MTSPTITWGHCYLLDCRTNEVVAWNATESLTNMLAAEASLTGAQDDFFTLLGTADHAVDDEYAYYRSADLSANAWLTNTYTTAIARYKTSASAAPGMGATCLIEYTAGSGGGYTELVGGTTPAFSSTWKTATATLTPNRTIQYVRLQVDDQPNTYNGGAGYAYFDFVLICQGIFTFPFVRPGGVRTHAGNRFADLDPLLRGSQSSQYLGMNTTDISVVGEMDTNTNWSANSVVGERLKRVEYQHINSACPWYWFTSDDINCKVTVRSLDLNQDSEGNAIRGYDLKLKQYSIAPADDYWYDVLQWYGK